MSTYGAVLPGATRLARLPAEPSGEAKRRLNVIRWYEGHGRRVRLTARYFGFSPDTVSRWVRAYRQYGPSGLEKGSRRPKRVRQPGTPLEVVQRIQALREEYPSWGREKLRVLLLREGIQISAKSIDRTIARLKARGVLREPLRRRKAAKARLKRLRRPPGLKVDCPGALVQLDSKQVRPGDGKPVFQFGALDCFTRKRVIALAPRLTSQRGAAFLERVVATFPFPVQAIQSDGGSEFLGQFGKIVSELKLVHYFNRPNYPQGNGRVERSFRTDDEEFYHVQELPTDLGGLETALIAWNQVYENVRPHQALGYRTPEQFYQQWLATQNQRKEVALSDMS
ncbi:MAG: DDE-type integrase/transposase/recombinase [Anaerolineae bacterium]|nr:DDE-type integrase/transposase/recombinase [Anaerolineae bacterium]NIN97976.1 DDE-type integrase/transposase/recombinase [Anaerolineae bacterium]